MKKLLFLIPLLLFLCFGSTGCDALGIGKTPAKKESKKDKDSKSKEKSQKDEPEQTEGDESNDEAPQDEQVTEEPTDEPEVSTQVNTEPTIEIQPEVGTRKLAKLWNEIDPETLLPIIADWTDEDLVVVFLKMDTGHVAEILSVMEASRSSRISQALQQEASKVVIPPEK